MRNEQQDLFSVPQFDPLTALLDDNGIPAAVVVGCGRNKLTNATTARRLYTSERFETACAVAETLGAPLYVLSGLHGLISPDETLSPYDVDLAVSDPGHKQVWREKVAAVLGKDLKDKQVCLLATDEYAKEFMNVISCQRDKPLAIAPLQSVDVAFQLDWHKQALVAAKRYRDLKQLYNLISLARGSGRTFLLRDLSKQKLPARGVYIFVDLSEHNFNQTPGRIVRIGTHAVSEGSKSTLKTRLRQHFGLADGTGNHRGSIFRLHVGRALLEKDAMRDQLQSWGSGQHAPSEIRALESRHEIRVSEYLRELEVYVLHIDDAPNKNSLRAAVERQLIALCSEELHPIDRASENWLGRYSPMQSIVKSGLWNLRDVGRKYEPSSVGSIEDICSRKIDQ